MSHSGSADGGGGGGYGGYGGGGGGGGGGGCRRCMQRGGRGAAKTRVDELGRLHCTGWGGPLGRKSLRRHYDFGRLRQRHGRTVHRRRGRRPTGCWRRLPQVGVAGGHGGAEGRPGAGQRSAAACHQARGTAGRPPRGGGLLGQGEAGTSSPRGCLVPGDDRLGDLRQALHLGGRGAAGLGRGRALGDELLAVDDQAHHTVDAGQEGHGLVMPCICQVHAVYLEDKRIG